MSDDEVTEPSIEIADTVQAEAESALASAGLAGMSGKIEGSAEIIVDHPKLRKLTNLFTRGEPKAYARANGLLAFKEAVGRQDDHYPSKRDSDGSCKTCLADFDRSHELHGCPMNPKIGFQFPDWNKELIAPDLEYRTSHKQATRKIIESMTKIFQREGDSGRRGFFGGR